MKREIAENIVGSVKKMEEALNDLTASTALIVDAEQRTKLRRAIASLAIDAHEKITLEVVKEFPDLHPHKGPT